MTSAFDRRSAAGALRILVTGAGGFVGRHLICHLMDHARNPPDVTDPPATTIVATLHDRQFDPLTSPSREAVLACSDDASYAITVQPLDVRDASATADLVSRVQPHQIYHLAARASGGDKDREGVFAVNVAGAGNLLTAASCLVTPPRVLLVSTGYVYGDTDPARPAREQDPISPIGRFGAYTDSKIEMEELAAGHREFVLVARAFGHTGPWQAPIFAIPSFARQLARIEAGLEPPELRVGNLEVDRDLIDVRDVVRAYRLFMMCGAPGQTVNVALGRPLSMRTILDRLCALCHVPVEVHVDPARLRRADIACSTGDPTALHALTGWQPR